MLFAKGADVALATTAYDSFVYRYILADWAVDEVGVYASLLHISSSLISNQCTFCVRRLSSFHSLRPWSNHLASASGILNTRR